MNSLFCARNLMAAGLFGLVALAPVAAASPHSGEGRGKAIDLSEMETRAAQRFSKADSNGDGQITESEFMSVERGESKRAGKRNGYQRRHHPGRGNLSDEQKAEMHDKIFDAADLNGDGQLSRSEASPENMRQARRSEMRKAMFARLDADGNGLLTSDEMPDRAARLRDADSNGDGQLSRDEMKAARKARRANAG